MTKKNERIAQIQDIKGDHINTKSISRIFTQEDTKFGWFGDKKLGTFKVRVELKGFDAGCTTIKEGFASKEEADKFRDELATMVFR